MYVKSRHLAQFTFTLTAEHCPVSLFTATPTAETPCNVAIDFLSPFTSVSAIRSYSLPLAHSTCNGWVGGWCAINTHQLHCTMVGVAINSHHLPNGRIGMKWSQPGNTAGPIFEQWIFEDGCNKKEYTSVRRDPKGVWRGQRFWDEMGLTKENEGMQLLVVNATDFVAQQ